MIILTEPCLHKALLCTCFF